VKNVISWEEDEDSEDSDDSNNEDGW